MGALPHKIERLAYLLKQRFDQRVFGVDLKRLFLHLGPARHEVLASLVLGGDEAFHVAGISGL